MLVTSFVFWCHGLCSAEASLSINKGNELLQRQVDMALIWCSSLKSSRPPDRCSSLVETGARRVLASNMDTFCALSRQPCFFLRIHPRHLALVIIEVGGVSEVAVFWFCVLLGCYIIQVPKKWHLLLLFYPVLQNILEEGEIIPFQDARRGLAMCLQVYSSMVLSLFPLGVSSFSPVGKKQALRLCKGQCPVFLM